ncbi:hypothetical protein F6H23_004248 [Vibrio fluvialis]|nr:hypothetical protein [Vibrio fluvialis]EMA2482778.1 hypothetical protein [Vibrio fluvialis]
MKKRFIGLLSLLLSSALSYAATTDYVNVKTINQYSVTANELLSASLTDLSPKAIEIGLREAELLASADYDKKTNVVTLQWHSISKTVKGTKLSENLAEPLTTRIKLSDTNQVIQARQALTASGDVEGIIDAYNKLLAKSKESVEVDASKSLETSTENDYSNKNDNGGGYLSGDNGGLSDNAETPTVEVNTDEIIESVEKCSLKVDLSAGLVSEQERTVKTSSNTGDVVEVSSCTNSGQNYPIRKDFEAGCTVKLDKITGQYQKGYKLYSMVEGSRYNISECEWSDDDKITYYIQRDFSACSVDLAVIKAKEGYYNPAFVNFTVIDGQKFTLSDCQTDSEEKRDLTITEKLCDYRIDYMTNKAFEQKRNVTYAPESTREVYSTSCADTQISYELFKDLDAGCSAVPNFVDKKLYFGFRKYFLLNDDVNYVTKCGTDTEEYVDISLIYDTCTATENLTEGTATIQKKWSYIDDQGKVKLVTDCVATDEIYPIVETTESCTPQYIAEQNKVLIQGRQGWQGSDGVWHFVSSCRPYSTELDVMSEVCDSPKYEHDFVGGQSYLRTRNYYEFNNEKTYLNSCSRDPSISFAHYKETTGCTAQNDDANMRTRLYQRTYALLDEGKTILKGCEASTSYVPYQYSGLKTYPEISYKYGCNNITARNLGDFYNAWLAPRSSYGTPTTWQPSKTNITKTSCEYTDLDRTKTGAYQFGKVYKTEDAWRRMDGSTYYNNPKVIVSW